MRIRVLLSSNDKKSVAALLDAGPTDFSLSFSRMGWLIVVGRLDGGMWHVEQSGIFTYWYRYNTSEDFKKQILDISNE